MKLKIKTAGNPIEIEQIQDTYSSNISSYINNADKWFDEIGLAGTNIKNVFLTKCVGASNVADPGNSTQVLNDELAIRLFILWLFSKPGGPVNFSMIFDSKSEKPKSLKLQTPGSPQFSSQIDQLYLEELKKSNDPKGFFNPLYNYLLENIESWTNTINPSITTSKIVEIKNIQNECFNNMNEELEKGKISREYLENCKKNYLIHLGEIISYLKKFLNELNVLEEKDEVGSGGKKKQEQVRLDLKESTVTWLQTKSLMSDSKGQIRKIVAYSKFKQFVLSFEPFNRSVLKKLGLASGEKADITNKNIFNYIYTNKDSRYNTSSKESIFGAKWATIHKNLKFENLENSDKLNEKLSGIMDWVAANIRTNQVTVRVLNGRIITDEDRIERTFPDGTVRLIFPEGTEAETYIDGEILKFEGKPMGLMMLNSQKHRQGTPSRGIRSFINPSQYDIENMIKSYDWNKMIEAETVFHKFLSQYREAGKNYEEKHGVLLDYRNGGKFGFYWAVLNSIDHSEESQRMSHCGRDNYGDLFSLRSMDIDNSKAAVPELRNMTFWTGNSWLTASVNNKGYIRQFKSIRNSRPSELSDFEKIVDLLCSELNTNVKSRVLPFSIKSRNLGNKKLFNGNTVDLSVYEKSNMIQPMPGKTSNPGFDDGGYKTDQDFHISDLPDNLLKKLYENRPDFFQWGASSDSTNEIDERLKNIYRLEKEAEKAEKEAAEKAEKERLKSEKSLNKENQE